MDYCLFPGNPSSRIRKVSLIAITNQLRFQEFNDIQQDKLEYCNITIPDLNNGRAVLCCFYLASFFMESSDKWSSKKNYTREIQPFLAWFPLRGWEVHIDNQISGRFSTKPTRSNF